MPASRCLLRRCTAIPPLLSDDTDGNLIDDGETLYTYNGENRLIEVHRKLDNALLATYHYDEHGRRIRKTTTIDASQGATDILFLWDNWLNIAELDHDRLISTITPRNYYTWGNDLSGSEQGAGGVGGLLFIRHFPADETHAYTYDGNGNVTGLYAMDNAGAESAQYEYAPFGEPLQATGPLANDNPYRFSTKYHDEETEFLYYGYRYYTPATGRWINRDPIDEIIDLNLYGAGRNSLLKNSDALGEGTISLVFGFDGTFKEEDTKHLKRFREDLEQTVRQCDKLAKGEGGYKCPNLNANSFNNIGVKTSSGGHFPCANPEDKKTWSSSDKDNQTIRDTINSIKKNNSTSTAILLTRATIFVGKTRAAGASAVGSNTYFLINVRGANRSTLPHELGHRIGWTDTQSKKFGPHHSDFRNNLMNPIGSGTPDCQFCSLLLKLAK